ncbi:MAG: TatD family hydrolase, partial [Candidatus Competibacterales bacterium]|nr:TatD family hydrolase [Candidatus Competibacterales bacterium]
MSRKRREIPRFEHPLIETHCHLDYLEAQSLEETLEQAAAVGIERIVTISVSPDNMAPVRELAERHPQVWCTQGIHPHEASHYDAAVEQRLAAGLEAPKVLAVGEIGLDYYYDHSDRAVQRAAFERQLGLAVERQLPVVIH